ncbi:flagellar hook protein FlgE [Catenuloplanes niger]|uniref:Flagellar hook protein FlgE n=2 Tax=Micromonosporaceae TaxID=28056 RepID=A0AAE3ZR11_9ACTN|nr:flagellar hook protein FlgE [Catenuloplanes niger]
MVRSAGSPQDTAGGTNPAQIGLGVKLAGINTNFSQGSAQTTGRSTDLMIQGDGMFAVKNGNETMYTRAGSFSFDTQGNMVTVGGQKVMGWQATDGQVDANGAIEPIKLPLGQTIAPKETDTVTLTGNLSAEAATTDPAIELPISVFTETGATESLTLSFTKTGDDAWSVELPNGGGTATINFTDGVPTTPTITLGDYTVDVSKMTEYSGKTNPKLNQVDGNASGTLASYNISQTGEIVGVFTNGMKSTLGQVALANFNNVGGLEKVGDSMYRTTVNSGMAQVGTPSDSGLGTLSSGMLEMSNVDLASEFTNLVIAQRGFQANSRIITTSDQILEELVNIKR